MHSLLVLDDVNILLRKRVLDTADQDICSMRQTRILQKRSDPNSAEGFVDSSALL